MEEMKIKIKAFLGRFYRKHELEDNEDIFALGFVNSLFAMQLVMFLEKTFSIQIESADMDLTNFSTINRIVEIIEAKQSMKQNS
ncbi:acyl carrier protein [Paenibacillus alvei]|uniref:acyl carrier protein n=1 Tax=Paenibacillus alvei TaxID=44250 RepID=UPI000385D936|nr:acyl carrier protein [Paenibacillus alvei]EPY14020.1 hypothetical protein PAAL66ix_04984 [Paenibacillus alvei A6-6i-x]